MKDLEQVRSNVRQQPAYFVLMHLSRYITMLYRIIKLILLRRRKRIVRLRCNGYIDGKSLVFSENRTVSLQIFTV
ncbi:hypothetical protein ASG19_12310 [Rhizobium sp. Leaf306]|nr:hypothetical protein ASG19_12310 [Rhizobium sp. Leaf306]